MKKDNIRINKLALEAFEMAVKRSGDQKLISLLTDKEKIVLGRRILIARAILAGKTRMEVQTTLSVSPNTFTQIKRWVDSEFSDYHSAHHATKAKRITHQKVRPFSFEHLAKKYPGHFLLFTLSKDLFE